MHIYVVQKGHFRDKEKRNKNERRNEDKNKRETSKCVRLYNNHILFIETNNTKQYYDHFLLVHEHNCYQCLFRQTFF